MPISRSVPVIVKNDEKYCFGCSTIKKKFAFNKDKKSKDGLTFKCAGCIYLIRDQKVSKFIIVTPNIITCKTCNKDKSYLEFGIRKVSETGRNDHCQSCFAKTYDYEQARQDRRFRVNWLRSLKEKDPCVDCGKYFPGELMDFDHLGDKKYNISYMVLHNLSKKEIKNEISKCEIVCCYCHGNRTRKMHDKKYPNAIENLRNAQKHRKIKDKLIFEARNKPCAVCNIPYPIHNMQLDHTNHNNKIMALSVSGNYSLVAVKLEIDKCQPVCVGCHRTKSLKEQLDRDYTIKVTKKDIKSKKDARYAFTQSFLDTENQLKKCLGCFIIKPFSEMKQPQKQAKFNKCINKYCIDCDKIYTQEIENFNSGPEYPYL